VLYVNVPERHVKALRSEFKAELTPDEAECLEEFIEIMRKKNPYFAM